MTKHVLVVDDDPSLTEFLRDYLTAHGYEASAVPDGAGLRRVMAERGVDLIVLDLNLPGETGFDIARYVRGTSKTPIIMLTGRSDEMDRVVGLEIGADDYVAKPFSVRELLARIGAVLRRTAAGGGGGGGEPTPAQPPTRGGVEARTGRFEGWRIDFAASRVFSPAGAEVRLTPGEFKLLGIFMTHPNRVLSREQLLDLARNGESDVFDRSVDIQVMRLRRKIETNPEQPTFIQTVRGSGYMFTAAIDWL
ncbi:MAG: response regulator transcription factor [Alphaproteobacteria bacterium]